MGFERFGTVFGEIKEPKGKGEVLSVSDFEFIKEYMESYVKPKETNDYACVLLPEDVYDKCVKDGTISKDSNIFMKSRYIPNDDVFIIDRQTRDNYNKEEDE